MEKTQRISVVDSLRGFAVVGIILIHFLEHLNFCAFPDPTPFEQGLWDTVFYLGSNKMYAIFSLLFGLSCYIQHHNQEKRGGDFRLRFAWRMLLLMLWGLLDLVFYNGDILCTYAVLGLFLIPLIKVSDRVLLICAGILFLQPIEIVYCVLGLIDPSTQPMDLGIGQYWDATYDVCANGSFFDVARVNLMYGLQINFGWAIEFGRFTQTLFLFILGMWIGRRRLFIDEGNNLAFWRKSIVVAIVLFAITQLLLSTLSFDQMPIAVRQSLDIQLNAWRNFGMMLFYVGGITLLYYRTNARKVIDQLSYIGKMSLSDYLLQSLVGGFLFYNWGLALYHSCSHFYSFSLAINFLLFLYLFCRYWTTHHRRGPLEELWARATWVGNPTKTVRRAAAIVIFVLFLFVPQAASANDSGDADQESCAELSETPAQAQTLPLGYWRGDINNNAQYSLNDLTLLIQMVKGDLPKNVRGDLNADKTVNQDDVQLLALILVRDTQGEWTDPIENPNEDDLIGGGTGEPK